MVKPSKRKQKMKNIPIAIFVLLLHLIFAHSFPAAAHDAVDFCRLWDAFIQNPEENARQMHRYLTQHGSNSEDSLDQECIPLLHLENTVDGYWELLRAGNIHAASLLVPMYNSTDGITSEIFCLIFNDFMAIHPRLFLKQIAEALKCGEDVDIRKQRTCITLDELEWIAGFYDTDSIASITEQRVMALRSVTDPELRIVRDAVLRVYAKQ